jgi:hypothetical protein
MEGFGMKPHKGVELWAIVAYSVVAGYAVGSVLVFLAAGPQGLSVIGGWGILVFLGILLAAVMFGLVSQRRASTR